MGGICSKSSIGVKDKVHVHVLSNNEATEIKESKEKEKEKEKEIEKGSLVGESEGERGSERGYGSSSEDEFYDGIPRFSRSFRSRSRSRARLRSRQASIRQVSDVSSRLGRAGTIGLEKAVDVLDTLGSSMVNLNTSIGFVSGVTTKGNELSILSFEVANTIGKSCSLMTSLSKRSIRQLKELVLPSDGVQHLVSEDMDELLKIVAVDKREELKIFAGEVVRFGNRCKDPQWHNLDLYFEKHSREPPRHSNEEADLVMQQLMNLVQNTAELYHALHVLDKMEHNRRYQDVDNPYAERGDAPPTTRSDVKSQRKKVRNLKKKSLWSRSMEEVMGKLVEVVVFLNLEIRNAFGSADGNSTSNGLLSFQQRLGPAGLDLHYANIVLMIDSIVARSSSMPPSTRNTLYQSLPPSVKSSLRSKLQSFHLKEELTITEIKAEMEKTLHWLVPIATNTSKAHHGFGWVGEWGSTGSNGNQKPNGVEILRIDTLHYADKVKTEAHILNLVLWLNHLMSQTKGVGNGGGMKSRMKSPIRSIPQRDETKNEQPTTLEVDSNEKRARGMSEDEDSESSKNGLENHDELSKSSSDTLVAKGESSSSVVEKDKILDVIDRVE